MRYAYFPGCAAHHGSAHEYDLSCKAVSERLGIELVEIPDWNCCGSIDAVYASNPVLSIALAARNLALAEETDLKTVVTLCSACLYTLARANQLRGDYPELEEKVSRVLSEAGLKSGRDSAVRHYLDAVLTDVGYDKISQNVKFPLKGLKVASYYGCLLVRPPKVNHFDDPEHPHSLERLAEALGAKSVDLPDKMRCCGASLVLTEKEVVTDMVHGILVNAKNVGADCIAVACPLCHFNLDARQRDIESEFKVKFDLPILFITQLMGMAFGLQPKELGLDRNCVSPMGLLGRLKPPSDS